MRTLDQILDPSRTAVLVVDVQNDFCAREGSLGRAGAPVDAAIEMVPRLQTFLTAAREHGVSVIFIQTIHERWTDSEAWTYRHAGKARETCLRDSWGSEFYGAAPLASEPVVVKHRYSAFVGTRLESVLHTLKIETVVMTGVATNVCVESTARDAFMRDFHTVFAGDCSAAYSAAAHDMTLENMRNHFGIVTTSADIVKSWATTHAVSGTGVS